MDEFEIYFNELSAFPLRQCQLVAHVDEIDDLVIVHSAVEEYRNPLSLVHVPGREDALLHSKAAGQHGVNLQVDDIYFPVIVSCELCERNIHDKTEPFAGGLVAKHCIVRCVCPGIVDNAAITLRCLFQYFLSHDTFTSYQFSLP